MLDPESSRLHSLERRVERLTSVLIIQSILLAVVVLLSALKAAPLITFCLIVGLSLLVFYRQSLPGWALTVGRFFGQFRSAPPSVAEADNAIAGDKSAN